MISSLYTYLIEFNTLTLFHPVWHMVRPWLQSRHRCGGSHEWPCNYSLTESMASLCIHFWFPKNWLLTVEDPTLFTATAQHTHTIHYGFRLLATQNGVDLTHIYRRLECKHTIILQDDHTVPIIWTTLWTIKRNFQYLEWHCINH